MSNSVPSEGSDPQKDLNHAEGSWEAIRKWFGKYLSQVLFFLGGLALYLLLGLFLWWLLQHYVDPSSIKDPSKEATAKKDLLQALGFIMAGVAGAIGIYFTWRGQRLTQESTQEELRITREGQITERFTQAIDQLGKTDEKGNKLLEIRLGGIYALERIARESEEDHWPIMEVLTAYVRQHAPLRPFEGQQGKEDAAVEKSENDPGGSKRKSEPSDGRAPDPDIQAIMTVLRRSRSFDLGEPERLDLSETDLRGANLREADLTGANLRGTDLRGASLRGADLTVARLTEANLRKAILRGTDLREADLTGANLAYADLTEANLAYADLTGADLTGAFLRGDLREADLTGADLTGADLTGAFLRRDLTRGSLTETFFSRADLTEVSPTEANLRGADLRGASLRKADLRGADLRGTDLRGASLRGASLRKADLMVPSLTQAQLEDTTGDEHTLLPPDLNPPVHWGMKTDDQIEGD